MYVCVCVYVCACVRVCACVCVCDLDNSIWKAGGSTGCARLLTGLNCSVSELMGVPLTPPLQCVATVGRD